MSLVHGRFATVARNASLLAPGRRTSRTRKNEWAPIRIWAWELSGSEPRGRERSGSSSTQVEMERLRPAGRFELVLFAARRGARSHEERVRCIHVPPSHVWCGAQSASEVHIDRSPIEPLDRSWDRVELGIEEWRRRSAWDAEPGSRAGADVSRSRGTSKEARTETASRAPSARATRAVPHRAVFGRGRHG